VHATAVTASQSMPAAGAAQRAYNGQLLQLLRALPSVSIVPFVLVLGVCRQCCVLVLLALHITLIPGILMTMIMLTISQDSPGFIKAIFLIPVLRLLFLLNISLLLPSLKEVMFLPLSVVLSVC